MSKSTEKVLQNKLEEYKAIAIRLQREIMMRAERLQFSNSNFDTRGHTLLIERPL